MEMGDANEEKHTSKHPTPELPQRDLTLKK